MNTATINQVEAIAETRIRALVVDDSPMMLKIMAQVLKEAGNIDLVGSATDGCQGLRLASALSTELVLMDLHMPHLNGIQATRYINGFERPPIVIIVTSDDSPSTKSLAEKAGSDGFIVKAGDLRRRLLHLLQDLSGRDGATQAQLSGNFFRNSRLQATNQDQGT